MSKRYTAIALVGALTTLLAGAAFAQDGQTNVPVYDYAVSHPTEDAQLTTRPSIGASVPPSVEVATSESPDGVYGYFYFQGRPVIVDLETRSIVRIDE